MARVEPVSDLATHTLREIVSLIAEITGSRFGHLRVPDVLARAIFSLINSGLAAVHANALQSRTSDILTSIRPVYCPGDNALRRHVDGAVGFEFALRRQI